MSTTQPHDRFAKEYLAELLTPFGTVTTDQKVQSEVLEMDVWFEPHDRPPQDLPATGFIQHLAHLPCLLEPYRNPVGIPDIRTCLLKLSYKPSLLEILADWQKNLALRDQRNRQEEEAIMNLSPVYLQQREAWKQEARQQGLQQGMQQGAQEGSASITLKLLRKRFGTLPIALEETIRRLSYEQLEALGDVLLDLPTVEELEAWLGLHA